MNLFTTYSNGQSPSVPVAPKTQLVLNRMTPEEKKEHLAPLTHLVVGNHVQVLTTHQGKGKGKKGKDRILRFPSPAQASHLNKVYRMVKTFTLTPIVSSTSVPVLTAYNFKFNSVEDYASLTAVFDLYRFAMIEVSFIPDANIASQGATTPLFHSCVDLDDSGTTSAVTIDNYPGAVVTLAYKTQRHTFVPHCALAAYGGAFTSYANVAAPWIDVASPAVEHYGVKTAFGIASVAYAYEVRVRVLLELKAVR